MDIKKKKKKKDKEKEREKVGYLMISSTFRLIYCRQGCGSGPGLSVLEPFVPGTGTATNLYKKLNKFHHHKITDFRK